VAHPVSVLARPVNLATRNNPRTLALHAAVYTGEYDRDEFLLSLILMLLINAKPLVKPIATPAQSIT
jgi:hypothetical protein